MECLLALIVGLAVGSFLNVCIYRIPKGESVVFPSSKCPECGQKIKWHDNIPLLSYLLLRGKCRNCKAPISPIYPIVELLTGVLTALVVCKFSLSFKSLYYLILIYYLIVISFIDMKTFEIPVKPSYFALLLGLFLSPFVEGHGFKEAVFGASLGAGIILFIIDSYYVFTGKEGMGYGDANILAVIGAFLGWKKVLLTLLVASGVGAFYGLATLKGRKEAIPFGPFLAIGAVVSLLFGEEIISWYLGGL